MENTIILLNNASVCVFGVILSAAFCEISWTRQKKVFLLLSIVGYLLLQGGLSMITDIPTMRQWYPLITHLPLVIFLYYMTRKKLWSVIAVLSAYLCCQLRRWIGLLAVAFWSGGELMQNAVELAVTLPILLLLLRFVAPAVRSLEKESTAVQYQFGMVPLLYYGFDYLTRIYTDLLTSGNQAALEFMPFVCSGAYVVFVIRTSKEKELRNQLEQTQSSLNLQVTQAVREIAHLRESQWQASVYRHDLRHHLQYLLACMENNRIEQGENYIREICTEIEANKVTVYCENEAANLILSAFAGRAKEQQIPLTIRAKIPLILPVSESDLCVLLSNSLENALHSCSDLKKLGKQGKIEVSAFEKSGKFFLQIANSCGENVVFANGIPVTDRPGHGVGVRSICVIVERYHGIYSFSAEGGQFVLRVSL